MGARASMGASMARVGLALNGVLRPLSRRCATKLSEPGTIQRERHVACAGRLQSRPYGADRQEPERFVTNAITFRYGYIWNREAEYVLYPYP